MGGARAAAGGGVSKRHPRSAFGFAEGRVVHGWSRSGIAGAQHGDDRGLVTKAVQPVVVAIRGGILAPIGTLWHVPKKPITRPAIQTLRSRGRWLSGHA
jgi:hypothetical protein